MPSAEGRPAASVATVAAPVDETCLDVLVVDDNEDAAATLAEVLRLMGHRVSVSNDAPAALDRVLAGVSAHDVYILDIGLPGMTGYELAARIRERAPTAHSLFVTLTGYGQPATACSRRAPASTSTWWSRWRNRGWWRCLRWRRSGGSSGSPEAGAQRRARAMNAPATPPRSHAVLVGAFTAVGGRSGHPREDRAP